MNSVFLKSKAAEIVYNYLQTKYNYNEYYFTISKGNASNNAIAHLQPKKMVLLLPGAIDCTDIPTEIKNPIEEILTSIYNAANGLELYKSLINHSKNLPGRWNVFNKLRSLNVYLTALIANIEISDIIHGDYITFKELVTILEVNIANLMVQLEELKKSINRVKTNPSLDDEQFIQTKIEKYTIALERLKAEKRLINKQNPIQTTSSLNSSDHRNYTDVILGLQNTLLAQERSMNSLRSKLVMAERNIVYLQQTINEINAPENGSGIELNFAQEEPESVIISQNASYKGTAHKHERAKMGQEPFFQPESVTAPVDLSSSSLSIN